MIFTDRTITVRKGESRIDEPIVVYRGDYELEVRFTILNSKFKFMSGTNMIESEKASYGQLAILTPYGGNIFSDIVRCNDGSVTFVLTAEMLNQIEEVGLYSFQIRLMDYMKESRVSIPPIEFGIEVREPIASEDHDNSVNNAIVGYSIAKVVDPKEENIGDTFDESGNYNKTNWETGDRISEGKLNKIEDAIDKINENEVNNTAVLSRRIDNNFNVLDSIMDEIKQNSQEKIREVESELAQTNAQLSGVINLDNFPKEKNEIDDTGRLIRAIESFDETIGGELIIPGDIRISSTIEINKTGIKLKGLGVKKSRIISNFSGVAIKVKPLRNGVPYTNLGYCRFFMEDISISAEGDAVTGGTGLWLQWVYSSNFNNIYVTGFKNNIVLKGSHLNKFSGIYIANEDLNTKEIFNKGVAISADGTLDEAGETSSNNNSFIGGTLHNSHLDLTNMAETNFYGIDIEPAGFTCNLGSNNNFSNCRFERFDIYELQGKSNYGKFTWFQLGSNNTIENCSFHQSGAHATINTPIFEINGDNNTINIKGNISYHNLINFGETTKNNVVNLNIPFQYHGTNWEQVGLNGLYRGDNVVSFKTGGKYYTLHKDFAESNVMGKIPKIVNFNDSGTWFRNEIASLAVDETPSSSFIPKNKLVKVSGDSTSWIKHNGSFSFFDVQETGVHTLNFFIKVDSGSVKVYALSGTTPLEIKETGGFRLITTPFYQIKGGNVQPMFLFSDNTVVTLGECWVSKDFSLPVINNSYPNQNVEIVEKHSSSSGILKRNTVFEYMIYDNNVSNTYTKCEGMWVGTTLPLIKSLVEKGMYAYGVNEYGTVSVVGSTDYTIILKYRYV